MKWLIEGGAGDRGRAGDMSNQNSLETHVEMPEALKNNPMMQRLMEYARAPQNKEQLRKVGNQT